MGGKGPRRSHRISDGKETPIGVIEKLHIHGPGEVFARCTEPLDPRQQVRRRSTRLPILRPEIRNPGSELVRKLFFAAPVSNNVSKQVGLAASQFIPGRKITEQSAARADRAFSQRKQELIRGRQQDVHPFQIAVEILPPRFNLPIQPRNPVDAFVGV